MTLIAELKYCFAKCCFYIALFISTLIYSLCLARELDTNLDKLAEQNIESFRKADILIKVKDKEGKPLLDADVSIAMQRHQFTFGTAVTPVLIAASREEIVRHAGNRALNFTSADSEQYQNIITKYFNTITIENELKWTQWYNSISRELADRTVQWAHERGIPIRGHCVVWPGWKHLPDDLKAIKNNPHQLNNRVLEHIANIVGKYRSQILEWDVINEPISNHDLADIVGKTALVDWIKHAHQINPNARLVVNDFGILASRKESEDKRDEYYALIEYLIKSGAPIDAIGMQGHFKSEDGDDLTPPAKLYAILDRFASLGKKIVVTEFDINLSNEQKQAEYMRDFMTVVFSHPSVQGIVIWGFWEGRIWRPFTALWRKDWSLKPSGRVWTDLVRNRWWTDMKGKTDKNGFLRTRGFLGDYRIIVKMGNRVKECNVELPKKGIELDVFL